MVVPGIGKSTLAVATAWLYSKLFKDSIIVSNMVLNIPGVICVQIPRVAQLLIYVKEHEKCIILIDEFDKSFTSSIGWVEKDREQALTNLVSNARKYGAVALIATSQGKKKIRNTFRLNCKYIMEPIGELDAGGFMEYFVWNDVELYETAGRARYDHGYLVASEIPLSLVEGMFDSRQTILMEWDSGKDDA